MNAHIDKHITDIYGSLTHCSIKGIIVSLVLSGGIRTIVITNMPLHITRYFTKIALNYNPINNKIHLRTDSADEDIANTFDIIGNDKQFNNTAEVIAFLNKIIHKKQCHKEYRGKYYKYKQKYLQLLTLLQQKL